MLTGKVTTKRVNVAKGKKINNFVDFAKVFTKLNVDQKTEVIKNLENTLATGKSPSGIEVKECERASTEKLKAWCTLNLMVGEELAPAKDIMSHFK